VEMALAGRDSTGGWSSKTYVRLLARIHASVRPSTYVEIGIRNGRSLAMALPGTAIIGIDPEPQLVFPVDPQAKVFAMTSDDFFAGQQLPEALNDRRIDLSFIDGMHHFEFSLRDFINLEKYSSAQSSVLIHDCYPIDAKSSTREHDTFLWSGDVWKLILVLKEYRPDLHVATVDVPPTGLGVITNLDPTSTVLQEHYEEIVEKYSTLPYDVLDGEKAAALNRVAPDWVTVRKLFPEEPFRTENPILLMARWAGRWAPYLVQRTAAAGWRRIGSVRARPA
jgi:hypothetical protein